MAPRKEKESADAAEEQQTTPPRGARKAKVLVKEDATSRLSKNLIKASTMMKKPAAAVVDSDEGVPAPMTPRTAFRIKNMLKKKPAAASVAEPLALQETDDEEIGGLPAPMTPRTAFRVKNLLKKRPSAASHFDIDIATVAPILKKRPAAAAAAKAVEEEADVASEEEKEPTPKKAKANKSKNPVVVVEEPEPQQEKKKKPEKPLSRTQELTNTIHKVIASIPFKAAPAAGVTLHPAAFTTFDADGYPSTRTVVPHYISDDLAEIRITSKTGTRKEQEISEDNRVSLHYHDQRGKQGWVTIKGYATLKEGVQEDTIEIVIRPERCECVSYNENMSADGDGWKPAIMVSAGSSGWRRTH